MRQIIASIALFLVPWSLSGSDWPDFRGPLRDGRSQEKNLPASWSPEGKNLAWKAPYGSRSAPVIFGDRLYLQQPVGKDATLQERLLCLNADTGKLLWEYRITVYHSDVPKHRIAWASPTVDPETGNIFVFAAQGDLYAISPAGKLLWEHALVDEGIITTHGGRTVSPIIEGDLVIVGGVDFSWGAQSGGAQRIWAFDKKSGEIMWMSTPPGRPTDTVYAPTNLMDINGVRQMFIGGSDGAVHALKPQTGEEVWKFNLAKRGINTGVVVQNNIGILSHSEENFDTNTEGLLAAVDISGTGTLGPDKIKWRVPGFLGEFSNPIIDGGQVYQVDKGAQLFAFDFTTGKELWKVNLGTVQKSSPVLADGKLYVGSESGKFFILKPGHDKCETLSEVTMPIGSGGIPEQLVGSAAVARGRIYVPSMDSLYAIGPKAAPAPTPTTYLPKMAPGSGAPAAVVVSPTELVLKPGQSVQLHARLFDAMGRFLREEKAAWSLVQLQGKVEDGKFTAPPDSKGQGGEVKATVGNITGTARLRVIPPLPWTFDPASMPPGPPPSYWVNVVNKYEIRDVEGKKLLVKLTTARPFHARARAFFGPADMSNYTIQGDVRAVERRRQMGDAGVVAQRYELVLVGSHQRVEIDSWQPEEGRTARKPFAWKADTWYRMKLEVQNLPDGRTRARGKVWPASDPEPAEWTLERVDKEMAGKKGSAGLYGNALNEIFYDNIKVTSNQ
jgi:outer membrane protein assembly factor BamB